MDNSLPELVFPAMAGRDLVARFDGGDLTSDAGLLRLAQADCQLGLVQAMAQVVTDRRDPNKIQHRCDEILPGS